MRYGTLGEEINTTEVTDEFETLQTIKRTKQNIVGWYFYSFSSEPFVVSAIATYIPLLLEQFARHNGVTLEDHSVHCTADHDKCVLGLFSNRIYIDTSSFALYTFSVSVFFQTLVVITVSGVVDIWNTVTFKRNVLLLFGIIGALSTILISRIYNTQYYMLAFLCILSNSCYGVVNVVGNSLLPLFVSEYLQHNSSSLDERDNVDILTTLISGRGASIGYSSALVVQIISIFLIKKSKSSENIQVATLFVGIWWLIWQLPMSWLLQDSPISADVTPEDMDNLSIHKPKKWIFKFSNLKHGWSSLFQALKHAKLLKDVVIFLVGWFIVSDSVTTINSTAILFAKTELKMSTLSLIVLSILTMINAILGAFTIPQFISRKFQLPGEKLLIYIILWASFIPFYGILGFVFKNIGLKHKFEMFITAIWYGISLGGLSAVSRSVFSLIIPRGQESTFFSIFNVTDKGSSILGPLLIGLITDYTHDIRYSFFLLFALLILAIPIFHLLDVERGKKEASSLQKIPIAD
ncbi:hypothetical protein Kpol_2000p102 [Vanderwaltozyma polyspora DSM 70294]|uniref:Autophagy-related protein 22 n=1 Tax=Vanderwaltozyma polyspora (strain ATCC 22028 / DSM 70294 / BCRC 21397 / CBS 2163 / NBRC 10782 / NRRL Y-8283 / UCD 57-17) TaxID=436907 RepID=ATG22_VANPO|nr:uncharacterized protein Kpol_2000p102 [Vanderwaltozyma polyspora DSM 70294]A7TFA9.1 RecName: Full=Autophagy-related protein 22 [Vanderwaltozyma polyspora DSM 70294]EDO19134.1 hypothetical protein Kpol_2000p102 [Vanderwaltozyma polyspora DSM 70294]